MEQRPEGHLTTRYIVALSVIAALILLGYGAERVRRPRASDAELIVIAGRQRMLGAQITRAALASATAATPLERDESLKDVGAAASMLRASHRLIRFGNPEQAIPGEIDQDMLKMLDRAEQQLEALVAAAHTVSRSSPGAGGEGAGPLGDLRAQLHTAEAAFVDTADDLIRRYSNDATAHMRSNDRLQLIVTGSLLVVLALQGAFVFAPAVRNVRDAIRKIQDSQATLSRLAAIVESTGDAIAGTSLDGGIQSWNHGAQAMFGLPAAEVIGKNVTALVKPQSRDALATSLARVAGGELSVSLDVVAAGAADRRIDLSVLVSPIHGANGKVESLSIIGHDITDRVQAQKMKSDFVSFVSHQLRTPLAGIKWMLELAADTPDVPASAEECIADARASADRLVDLVNDLLDVSRLEEGRLPLSMNNVQLDEMTQGLIQELDGLVRQKSIALTYTTGEKVPQVLVDAKLMRQALANLMSNAIKYTPADGRIELALERDAQGVRWRITDSGIGIPAASQPRLFEKFYRADNALTVETEGTGLGLYLVRLIVTKFGGRIWCESQEGSGSTFVVTLPSTETAA